MIQRLVNLVGSTPLRRNIGMTMVRQMMAAVAQFLLVILVARELGPEGNGFYAMAILIPTMLANFLNFGVGPATVYYVSRGDAGVHQSMAGNLLIACVTSIVGIVFACPVFMIWGAQLFPGVPKVLLFLGLASFPLTLLLSYLNAILQGLEDFKAFNLTILVPPYVNLFGVFIALYFLPFGVVGAMVAYIAGQLVGLLIVFRLLSLKKVTQAVGEIVPLSSYVRRALGYGWKTYLSNIITFVNYRADVFLINFFLSPAAAGVYVIAVQISEKLWMPSQAAGTVLFPRLAAMSANPVLRLNLTKKAFFIVVSITAFLGGLAALLLNWLIGPIFGNDYLAAYPAFLWLLPGAVLWAGGRIQANCIAAAGKPEWNMYVSIFVLAINLIGNIFLIPKYGVVGAACATSAAYIFDAVVKFCLVNALNLSNKRRACGIQGS